MADLEFTVDGYIGYIKLNRPDVMNAFSQEMITLWKDALLTIRDNEEIRLGIITGNGKAFCAGGDLKALVNGEGFMAKTDNEKNDHTTLPINVKNSLWKYIQQIPLIMQDIDKPMIAAINGPAIGAGLDMALSCDIRFCSEEAKLGEGYINAAIVPGDGGGFFLPRLIGIDKALDLLWTGRVLSAHEAKEIGLVTNVVPHDRLMSEVEKYADRLVRGPQEVIRMIKRTVYESQTMTLKQSLDLVSSFMSLAVHHPDHQEAVQAIREKRQPNYH